jgi:hypothetical protein
MKNEIIVSELILMIVMGFIFLHPFEFTPTGSLYHYNNDKQCSDDRFILDFINVRNVSISLIFGFIRIYLNDTKFFEGFTDLIVLQLRYAVMQVMGCVEYVLSY